MAQQQKPPSPLEVTLSEAQVLVNLWLKTRAFFAKSNTEDPIGREEEQAFLESKSEISRCQRALSAKIPPDAVFPGDKMVDLLRQSISIGHLRALPKADRQTLMANWHAVFVQLCRSVGALQFMVEGYIPPERAKKTSSGNISELKRAAATGDKGKKKSGGGGFLSPKMIVIIVLFAVAGYFVWKNVLNR